jgi:YVTN family beta-propeller protein
LVRRAVLATLAAAAALASAGAPVASARDGYVATETPNSVSAVDLSTGLPVGTSIPVGVEPRSIAISPDGSRAYVANFKGNSVSVIDTKTNQVVGSAIPAGSEPIQLIVSPDGTRLYVRHFIGSLITVIDTATDKVVGEFPRFAGGIALSPDGKLLYVSESEEVGVYDALTGQPAGKKLPADDDPAMLILSPDDQTLFALHPGLTGTVTPIDLALGTKRAAIPVGERPVSMTITPDGSKLLIGRQQSPTVGFVERIDTAAGKVIGFPVGVGANPYDLAMAPDGKLAWTGDGAGLQSIDTAVGTPTTYKLPGNHTGVAIVPDQGPIARLAARLDGTTATLDASGSSDPDGHVASYTWDFGDGTTAEGPAATATHTYAAGHTYVAQVTATDGEGCGPTLVFDGVATFCNPSATPSATATIVVPGPSAPAAPAPAPSAPGNKSTPGHGAAKLRLGRLRLNPKNGTASLIAVVSGPGKLMVGGQAARRTVPARRAGKVKLAIAPGVGVKRVLEREGHASAKATVRFTAPGLPAVSAKRTIGLIERPADGAGRG